MYIVLEYLLLENFIINYFTIYLTKILVKTDTKAIRMVIASIVASLYSLVFFYPSLIFLTKPFAKMIFSMIIIRISFNYSNIKLYFKQILGFYLVSFIFAGATIGIFFSSNNLTSILNKQINVFEGFPVKILILGVLGSVILSKVIFQYYNARIIRENYIADLNIVLNQEEIRIKVLLDTGNSLIDPFTNNKVLVVEYSSLKSYLPQLIEALLKANEEFNYKEVEQLLNILQKEINLNMIPFKSIGKSGLLFSFKPDYIIIDYMGEKSKRNDIIVGIYPGTISKSMGYSGLLHYELINGGVVNENIKVQN